MKKIKALLITGVILLVAFVLGFVLINLIMKIAVGHRNEVEVPDLVNMNYEVAIKKCKKRDLYARVTEYIHSNEFRKNRVISQKPHTNIKTKKYNTIELVVSKGPEVVHIPYLDNLTVSEAKIKLKNAGLKLGKKEYQYSDEVNKGKIIYTQPMADDLIPRGNEVKVIISLGKLSQDSYEKNKYKKLLNSN